MNGVSGRGTTDGVGTYQRAVGGRGTGRGTWAERLGSSLPLGLNKNVLEIVLEKDERGSFNVSDTDCARVMGKLGLDPRPDIHVESVQICPQGRGIILITLKKEIEIQRFCRYDVFMVTESGIRAVNVKPAGKRDVVINMKGIHPNTRDDSVIEYLAKYGKIVSTKVVYGVYLVGPLKGFRNGDRAYKIEVKPNVNIGTYHVIDGCKVTARYPGQQQTCARCFETPQKCPGKGMARNCEAANGTKVDFCDYIQALWVKIGYSPEKGHLTDQVNEDNDQPENIRTQEGGFFTPAKLESKVP